jgi:hypothetical protein
MGDRQTGLDSAEINEQENIFYTLNFFPIQKKPPGLPVAFQLNG